MLKSVFRFGPVVLVVVLASCGPLVIHTVLMGGIPGTPGFTPGFDPDPVPVHRGDQIHWTNPYRETVLVHLERAPVSPTFLEIPTGETGRVTVLAEALPGRYKYTVSVMVEGDTIVFDPYIDVEEKSRPGGGS